VKTAVVLGGTGMIGRAVVERLRQEGWRVIVAGRGQRDPAELVLDRERGLGSIPECDTLVDVIAFNDRHAAQLLTLADRVGSLVVISSASVYADEAGRSLDEAEDEKSFPYLPVPISETQQTVEPGDETYSTRKVALERALLEQDVVPATVIRPCAVHGPGTQLPRELYFVKRALDGRRVVLLAYRGESIFHTTSVDNLAELVRLAAERPGTRVLNCGDPDPPSVLEISRAISRALEWDFVECLLPGKPEVADNPWAAPRPFLLDMRTAEAEVGYRPVTGYEGAVGETIRWLAEQRPEPVGYMADQFDYEAEDEYVRGLAVTRELAP
jgi:nucleoside-diphosphate-sugar epimerase